MGDNPIHTEPSKLDPFGLLTTDEKASALLLVASGRGAEPVSDDSQPVRERVDRDMWLPPSDRRVARAGRGNRTRLNPLNREIQRIQQEQEQRGAVRHQGQTYSYRVHYTHVIAANMPHSYCQACGGRLTSPQSISRGYGPTCYSRLQTPN